MDKNYKKKKDEKEIIELEYCGKKIYLELLPGGNYRIPLKEEIDSLGLGISENELDKLIKRAVEEEKAKLRAKKI